MRPSLDLTLASDGSLFRQLWFRISENHGAATRGPQCTATIVVNFHTLIDVGSMPDVETVIRTAKDINEKRIC